MTAIVGLLCKDGAVIGADSSATMTSGVQATIQQPHQKIHIFGESVIVAGTGDVGLGQRFQEIVDKAWDKKEFGGQRTKMDIARSLARTTVEDFRETQVRNGKYGALVAFPTGNSTPHLCEFGLDGFQPTFLTAELWHVSMGSGQPITDPFLGLMREIFWADGPPSLETGAAAIVWTLQHVCALSPGGVREPIHVAVLEPHQSKKRARMLSEDELGQHFEFVAAAKDHLRAFPSTFNGSAEDSPALPDPD